MFCTFLRNFYSTVAKRQGFVAYPFDLITENHGQFGLCFKILQHHAPLHLFDSKESIPSRFQLATGFCRCTEIAPRHGLVGTQGRLMDFAMRRTGRDAA